MQTRWICLAFLTLILTGIFGLCRLPSALADTYPYQSQPFVMDGAISHVDVDRDRVTFTGSDGKTYTLDTSQTEITLIDGNHAGMTPDLSPGMRVHVSGHLLSAGIAEVEQMRVLDASQLLPPHPSPPAANTPGSDAELPPITLRGTVDSINTRQGSFVVRVKDKVGEHTRMILLADNTDVSGMALTDSNQFPVKIGDRVTVAGSFEPDKTVLAGVVSLSRDVSLPPVPPRRAPVLLGRVSSTSNRYTSRDIKIRLGGNNQEIKIKVPRGISIWREGQAISIHDLRGDDPVRVTGTYEGSDFRASKIDVLGNPDASDAQAAPGRRGL